MFSQNFPTFFTFSHTKTKRIMKQQLTIIGSETLLGQHLVKAIEEKSEEYTLKLWNYQDGFAGLDEALAGSHTVFNLHEAQDFSLLPNAQKLQKHNVDFVGVLLEKCKAAGTTVLVHLSTTYLQCSTKWPNVYGRESEQFQQYRAECPFPAYCESKHEAERLVGYAGLDFRDFSQNLNFSYNLHRCIARIGALYGEEDRQSLVCDSILMTKAHGSVPRIGEPKDMGTFQFTYAGNAAQALLKCAQKMATESKPSCETVIICDDTPLKDIYSLLLEPLQAEEEERGNIRLGRTKFHFWLFFLPYWLCCLLIWVFSSLTGANIVLNKLPSPNYPYLLLRHWTFYSGYKLRIFFDFRPPFDWSESLKRSRDYYRQLKPEDICGPSWLSVD